MFDAWNILVAIFVSLAATSAFAQPVDIRDSELQSSPDGTPPSLVAPISVRSSLIVDVPGEFMERLTGRDYDDQSSVEVLDLVIQARSSDMEALPPSLLPTLFIGRANYRIQRVEYSNWNLTEEAPYSPNDPIAEFQYHHVFIPDWKDVPSDAPMVLTVLEPDEYLFAIDNEPTSEIIDFVFPEIRGRTPLYDLEAYLRLPRPTSSEESETVPGYDEDPDY